MTTESKRDSELKLSGRRDFHGGSEANVSHSLYDILRLQFRYSVINTERLPVLERFLGALSNIYLEQQHVGDSIAVWTTRAAG
ncbi:hypothetical protein RRG08_046068 [Elysia crispata]|uniref:Uncharacterized protein n=1 Tax=Elysia crispata TaxID=231223 RepID=A0AAE1CST4_9GAST|nr:hypothetical protein RRG08_046068 [Elysia crispata]